MERKGKRRMVDEKIRVRKVNEWEEKREWIRGWESENVI